VLKYLNMSTYNFSHRATNIPNSGIGQMMRYASKYPDVISLGQGTPLFPTPQFIYDKLYEQSKTNSDLGMYSGPKLENPLKELIIKQVNSLYGFTPKSSEILLTGGGNSRVVFCHYVAC
jgi:aspartate/methionine/tyrosine aminotransferase